MADEKTNEMETLRTAYHKAMSKNASTFSNIKDYLYEVFCLGYLAGKQNTIDLWSSAFTEQSENES